MNYTPKQLYARLKKTVVDQDDYLKKLSTIVWLHDQRIRKNKQQVFKDRRHQKQNLMVVGPTGTGKTLALTTLAKIYGYDVVVVNAVDLTGTGWKGKNCEDIIKDLYLQCERSTERTEQGIVLMDEVDKMLLQSQTQTEPSFAAENSLLKIIEGMTVSFTIGDSHPVKVSTDNILFICGGAFEGIGEIVEKRLVKKKIGFMNEEEHEQASVKVQNWYQHITREDLINYGVGAQFMGRFADIAYLQPLDRTALKNILLESDYSMVKDMDSILRVTNNVEIKIDEAGAEAVANLATREGTGARGLNQVIIPRLQDALFNIDEIEPHSCICISADETGEIKLTKEKSDYLSEKIEQVERDRQIKCRAKKNRVENYADYVLSAYPHLADANVREIRAAHALICCIVMYILLECPPADHRAESIYKLLDFLENPDEYSDESITEFLLSETKDMDYHFYFNKFTHLDPSKKSIKLAQKAVEYFMREPKYELQALG